jgi:Domain of unknown function (DUF4253)
MNNEVPASVVMADVPPEGELRIGDAVVAGRRLVADPDFGGHEAPVAWYTDDRRHDFTALFHAARADYAVTGLWPVLLDGLMGDLSRPWDDGEIEPDDDWRAQAAAADPARILASYWDDTADDRAMLHPFTSFPGLATVSGPFVDRVASIPPSNAVRGVALVPVCRPADVVAQLGWLGPTNHGLLGADLTAVLRSWEDRFGAVVVALGFDTLSVMLCRGPADRGEALGVAAEFFAACPDTVWQGVESIEALASALLAAPAWQFWWD